MSFLTTCPFFNCLSFKLLSLLNELNLSSIEDTKIKPDFIGFQNSHFGFIYPLLSFRVCRAVAFTLIRDISLSRDVHFLLLYQKN